MHNYRYKRLDNYVLIDVNTSGIRNYDRITEICLLKVENNEVVKTYYRRVNPNYNYYNRKWDKWDEYLEYSKYPLLISLKDEILKFIGRKNIIGWCLDFDIEHLQNDLCCYLKNNFVDVHDCYRKDIKRSIGYGSLINVYTYIFEESNDCYDYDFDNTFHKCYATKQLYDSYKHYTHFLYELRNADYIEFPNGDRFYKNK